MLESKKNLSLNDFCNFKYWVSLKEGKTSYAQCEYFLIVE